MANTYSAGVATAYGAAVRGGYTGTYAEWCAAMADFGDKSQQAIEAAEQAAQSAAEAVNSATDAAGSASAAAVSEGNAADSASAAATSETNIAGSASAAAQSATAAAGSATAAATSESNAAESAAAAQAVKDSIPEDYTELSNDVDDLETYVRDMSPTVSVGPASILSIPDAAPLSADAAVVDIEPVQAGSGDPSPDNVRPITGWTGMTGVRCGKNLFNGTFINAIATTNGTIWYLVLRASALSAIIPVKPNAQYTISKSGGNRFILLSSPKEPMQGSSSLLTLIYNDNNVTQYTFTTDSSTKYIVLTCTTDITVSPVSWVQLEAGSVKTDYEPYQGNTFPITFPSAAGMVYGGTLDLVVGKLTVDRGYIDSYDGEALPGAWISSMDVYSAGSTPTTGAQVVYVLATPTVYDIDPVTLALPRGANTIWADCGDMSLTYRQDVAILLAALTAPDETDMTANTNYAVDSFFTVGGTLYKATAAIATGETIQPGTNCVATSIAEQLTAIYARLA